VVIPTVAAPATATLAATSANLMLSRVDATTAAAAALKSAASFAIAAAGYGSSALHMNQQADLALISSEESPLHVHPAQEISRDEFASFDEALFKGNSQSILSQRVDATTTTTTERQGRGEALGLIRNGQNVPAYRGENSHAHLKGAVQEVALSTVVLTGVSSSRALREGSGEMEKREIVRTTRTN